MAKTCLSNFVAIAEPRITNKHHDDAEGYPAGRYAGCRYGLTTRRVL